MADIDLNYLHMSPGERGAYDAMRHQTAELMMPFMFRAILIAERQTGTDGNTSPEERFSLVRATTAEIFAAPDTHDKLRKAYSAAHRHTLGESRGSVRVATEHLVALAQIATNEVAWLSRGAANFLEAKKQPEIPKIIQRSLGLLVTANTFKGSMLRLQRDLGTPVRKGVASYVAPFYLTLTDGTDGLVVDFTEQTQEYITQYTSSLGGCPVGRGVQLESVVTPTEVYWKRLTGYAFQHSSETSG